MNKELVHDFIKFIMENYGIRLTMTKSDAEIFEAYFPDLVEILEKENDTGIRNIKEKYRSWL